MPFPYRVAVAAETAHVESVARPLPWPLTLETSEACFAGHVTLTGPWQIASVASVRVSRSNCIGQSNMSPWAISSSTGRFYKLCLSQRNLVMSHLRNSPKPLYNLGSSVFPSLSLYLYFYFQMLLMTFCFLPKLSHSLTNWPFSSHHSAIVCLLPQRQKLDGLPSPTAGRTIQMTWKTTYDLLEGFFCINILNWPKNSCWQMF